MLLDSDHVHRIYLKELGAIDQLPLEAALMVLTTKTPKQVPAAARETLARSQAADIPSVQRQAITNMVGTIMTDRFTTLSRQEHVRRSTKY
jgi:predicted transposase YdaD